MDFIIKSIVSAKYIFAKTMSRIPHEYTLRDTWEDQELFNECVQYIRDHGKEEYFMGKKYIYFYYENNKYWTMGNPIDQTKLINRARCD